MLHASVVTKTAEFSDLRDEWFNLISRSSTATIFDTFEWQFSWWNEIGRKKLGARLQIVLVRDDSGLLVGILPFYSAVWLIWPLRVLSIIGSRASDYHDIIAAAGSEQEVCREFRRWLVESNSSTITDLDHLRESGVLRRYINPSTDTELQFVDFEQEECPFLLLPEVSEGDSRWDALLAGYSKKMRSNIRYYNRSLDKVYTVDRVIASTAGEVDEALTALFDLHQRRWNQRWLPGAFYSAAIRRFHRRAAKLLIERQWLRLHSIKLDESIEAVLYCFSFNKSTSYYQGGFEPSLAKLSLGTVITSLAIRQAAEEGSSVFDFLRGDEPYKTRWTMGTSAWNHRWIVAKTDSSAFSFGVALAKIELRVEQRFKEWMHHRGSEKLTEAAAQEEN